MTTLVKLESALSNWSLQNIFYISSAHFAPTTIEGKSKCLRRDTFFEWVQLKNFIAFYQVIVSGHLPKTKELLEFLFLFAFWIIFSND